MIGWKRFCGRGWVCTIHTAPGGGPEPGTMGRERLVAEELPALRILCLMNTREVSFGKLFHVSWTWKYF